MNGNSSSKEKNKLTASFRVDAIHKIYQAKHKQIIKHKISFISLATTETRAQKIA